MLELYSLTLFPLPSCCGIMCTKRWTQLPRNLKQHDISFSVAGPIYDPAGNTGVLRMQRPYEMYSVREDGVFLMPGRLTARR